MHACLSYGRSEHILLTLIKIYSLYTYLAKNNVELISIYSAIKICQIACFQ